MATENPRIELHIADPKKLASVVAFIERLSGEKLSAEDMRSCGGRSTGHRNPEARSQ